MVCTKSKAQKAGAVPEALRGVKSHRLFKKFSLSMKRGNGLHHSMMARSVPFILVWLRTPKREANWEDSRNSEKDATGAIEGSKWNVGNSGHFQF